MFDTTIYGLKIEVGIEFLTNARTWCFDTSYINPNGFSLTADCLLICSLGSTNRAGSSPKAFPVHMTQAGP